VSAEALATRQNCRSPRCISNTAGTNCVPVGVLGEVIGT
jgi:hypothetical protein